MPDVAFLTGKYKAFRDGVQMPFAWLSSCSAAGDSQPIQAAIDTGAFGIILSAGAAHIFGMDLEEIFQKEPSQCSGLGASSELYSHNSSIRIRASQRGGDTLLIENARIFVSKAEKIAGWHALFGQLDGLQQRWLRHHNHNSHRFWQLTQAI